MQIGVSSYSFSGLVKAGQLDRAGVIAKAKEIGFDTIEFSHLLANEGETPEETAQRTREECAAAGFEIANYTIGADFLNRSGSWEAEVDRLKGEVRIAQVLGAAGMRHDATRGFAEDHVGARGFDDALPILIKGCRAVTECAADLGVRTMVENHGLFCQDSDRVEKLVNGVNHPNFGLLVDMGNFVCVDEDPAVALGRVMPYAVHVHAKDFHLKPGTAPDPGTGWGRSRGGNYIRGSIIGHGDVPVVQCLRIMKKAGYDGGLSIEFEGMEPVLDGIRIGHDNLRRFVAEIW